MAALPPNLSKHDFIRYYCRTEDMAREFAMSHGLLSNPEGAQQPVNTCLLGQPGCQGVPYATQVFSKGKHRHVLYCPRCRRTRSPRNGVRNGVLCVKGQLRGTVKAPLGRFLGSVTQGLLLIYYWAEGLLPKDAMKEVITQENPIALRTVQQFFNHMNVLAKEKMDGAPAMQPMQGCSIQIDEALFKGKRKNHHGRNLQLDLIPGARARNYGDVVQGPWVFGLVCRDQDNSLDLRMFVVPRRDEATLMPIVVRHAHPNSTVQSDCWGGYINLSNWGGVNNYNHLVVNHEENFIDPLTGANTQQIEGCWAHVKLALMRLRKGAQGNLDVHLAAVWFKLKYRERTFASALEMAAQFREML